MEEKQTPEEELEAPAPEKTVLEVLEEETSEEAPEETKEETVEEGESEDPPAEEKPRTVPVSAVQKERQRRREAEERAKELESRITALESRKPPTAQQELQKPRYDQFDSIEAFNDAMADYVEKRAEAVAEEKAQNVIQRQSEAEQERSRKAQAEKEYQAFLSQVDKAHEKYEDFEDSFDYVDGVSHSNPGYARAITTSDVVGDLINYLAKHPEEAERISSLSNERAVKAIGVIEDKIKAPPPKPKTTTQAPAPINPVSGNAKTSTTIKWKPDMTPAEKAAWRKQAMDSGVSVAEILE